MSIAEGGCLCGEIRYGVSNPPLRVTLCHCRFCQRATGGAYLVEPIFSKSDFTMLKGQPKQYDHRSTGSKQMVHVHFCENCGTKINLSFERFPDVVGLFGGTFDNPDWFERSPTNSKHIFLAFAQDGTVIPAGFDTFDNHAITNDGTPIAPSVFQNPKQIKKNRN